MTATAAGFTTCAFLPSGAFLQLARKSHSIRKEIRKIQKAINLNSLRPYVLDYFNTKVKVSRTCEIEKQLTKK